MFSSVLSALTMDQLQQQLMSEKILTGHFQQTKTMQMFNQPLISDGTFLLSQQHGLIWQQSSPFAVMLVLADDKLLQQFSEQSPQIIEAKDNPMVFYFSHLFLSLFKGDIAALQSQFDMQLQGTETERWLLRLTPKVSPLDKVFKHININGKQQIESLSLIELNDDSTLIEFNDIQLPTMLSKEQIDRFSI